jgi:flagella basal body P-ring formation protein FlgA
VAKLIVYCVTLAIAGMTFGAELQLRDSVRPAGPLVLLGDVAEIHGRHSVETAELAAMDLFPLPPSGEKRVLRLREIQDLLAVRGVNLADHRFSGASQVVVSGPKRDAPAALAPAAPAAKSVSRNIAKQPVIAAITKAIEEYLNQKTGEEGWQISLSLSDDRVEKMAEFDTALIVVGGKAPWTGKQKFLISAENTDKPPVTVTVHVAVPPSVVVARYPLPKGVILRADDVKLQRGLPTKGEADVYQTIEDVVGKETTRVITENQILDSRSVRRQLLVRRNEIVTIYSRASGVSVRTTARVRDDGAEGDLVTVETLQDRKPLFARVSGPQEVEIFAQAVSAAAPTQQSAASDANVSHDARPAAPLPGNSSLTSTAVTARDK